MTKILNKKSTQETLKKLGTQAVEQIKEGITKKEFDVNYADFTDFKN